MKLSKALVIAAAVFSSCSALAQPIDISKLSDSKITDGYKKSMFVDVSGSMENTSGESVSISLHSSTSPGNLVEKSGKKLLRIDQKITMTSGNEAFTIQSPYFVDPITFLDVYSEGLDGEESWFTEVRDYPERISIGEKIVLKKGRTINIKRPQTVLEQSITYLELFPSKAKEGLFDLCETDVDYQRKTKFKKPSRITATCDVINDNGESLGFSIMTRDNDTLTYMTGTLATQ